jgi:hypothetical protein
MFYSYYYEIDAYGVCLLANRNLPQLQIELRLCL